MNRRINRHGSNIRASVLPRTGMAFRVRPEEQNDANNKGRPNNEVKTSTPNRERTHMLDPAEISCIEPLPGSSSQLETSFIMPINNGGTCANTQRNLAAPKKLTMKSEAVSPNSKLYNQFLMAHNHILHTKIQKALMEKHTYEKEAQIDQSLAVLKKRIIDNEDVINKTKEHINTISLNQEIETLLKKRDISCKPNVDQIKKLQNTSGHAQKINAVKKELKRMQDKINCENIVIPKTKPEFIQLKKILEDAASASTEPLGGHLESKEMSDFLKKFDDCSNKVEEMEASCRNVLPNINSLVLKNCSHKIFECEEEKENLEHVNNDVQDS